MRTPITLAILAVVIVAWGTVAVADTAEMRDGMLIQGKYVGGTAGTIRMETPEGVKVLETGKVLALTFDAVTPTVTTAPAAAPAPAPAAAAVPAAAPAAIPAAAVVPPAAPKPVTVPAGAILTIKLDGPVSSSDPKGTKFTGRLLADLTADGQTVAKAGSMVHGQVDKSKEAGRLAGKSELEMSLTGVDIGGRIQPIVTTNFSETGKGSFRKTARNTAAGAAIGAAADDNAGTGAAIGAGVSLIRKGEAVTAPAGMILEFRLTQPFEATAAQ